MTNSALLLMDVQNAMVGRLDDTDLPVRLGAAAETARSNDIQVIHVVVGFRRGHPEVHQRNPTFSAMPTTAFTPDDPNAAIHADLGPRPDETVVAKRRISAFAGSDLDMVLRAADIEHLVLAGIATSGVVLSTVRQAADLDYQLTVLSDGCADHDPEVHRVLLEKVFARQADVTTIDAWTEALART